MKVVVYSQYRENYGEPGNPHWKCKGGDTYVVSGLTREQAEVLSKSEAFDTLIDYKNEMAEEYVSAVVIHQDDAVICDEWEAPIVLDYSELEGRWTATVSHKNDGQFREEILRKYETWTMLPGNKRENYSAEYAMVDGQILTEEGLIKFYDLKG